eukprot:2859781-Alexandrium_andersonii.AAC.1
MHDHSGQPIVTRVAFQVANVTRPALSTSRLLDQGSVVRLGDPSYIHRSSNDKGKVNLELSGNLFLLPC